jgi:hypothetical protein
MSLAIEHPATKESTVASLPFGRRLLATAELLAVVAILEIAMWELCGPFHVLFCTLAFPLAGILVWNSHRRRRLAGREQPSTGPPARDTLARAWLKTLALTLVLALLIPLLASATRIVGERFRLFWLDKGSMGLVEYLAGKSVFIIVQQILLQYFLLPCSGEITARRRWGMFCAAAVFGLVHLPSLLLVGITMVAGYAWLWLFAGGRRILPLAASHLALALIAHAALPERLTLNMRVGAPALEVASRYRALDDPQTARLFRQYCSDDYYARSGGADGEFIAALYRDILLRRAPASDAEMAVWTNKLANHSRADIVAEFFGSREFAALADAGHGTDNADTYRR